DAGDLALRPGAPGLLAARTLAESDYQVSAPGEGPSSDPVRRIVRGDLLRPAAGRRGQANRLAANGNAHQQCPGGVRRLPGQGAVAQRPGRFLSTPAPDLAGLAGGRCGPAACDNLGLRDLATAPAALSRRRLVLVPGDARAGHRPGTGGRAGDGRPLHV